jgi:hypothetical protein
VNEITLMRFVPPTGPGRFKERFILSALSIYLNQCGQDFLERKLSTCVHAVMSQKHPGRSTNAVVLSLAGVWTISGFLTKGSWQSSTTRPTHQPGNP